MKIFFAMLIPIIIWTFLGVALIYVIVKRINDKKHEDFEKRDN